MSCYGSFAAWLGQRTIKQAFKFAYAFAELSRIFRQRCKVIGGFLTTKELLYSLGIVHRQCELYNMECKGL